MTIIISMPASSNAYFEAPGSFNLYADQSEAEHREDILDQTGFGIEEDEFCDIIKSATGQSDIQLITG